MKFAALFFCFLTGMTVFWELNAQKRSFASALSVSDYDWKAAVVPEKIVEKNKKVSAEYLKHLQIFEYFYDRKGNLRLVELVHKIVKINDNKALQQFNKVFIENHKKGGILKIKARAVSPSGKMTELGAENIHQVQNIGSEYHIFAVEGAEKGGIIEFFYLREIEPDLHGEEFLQNIIPTQNLEFQIISPKNLIFTAKSYNGLSQPVQHHFETHNLMLLREDFVPAAQVAPFLGYTSHLKRINFKLQNDFHKGDYQHLSWNDIADQVASSIYEQPNDKSKAILLRHIYDIIAGEESEEAKITKFDNYVKNYIRKKSFSFEDFSDWEKIFEHKMASEPEIIKLYAFFFDALQIEHQLVVTSNRSRCKFDADFPTWDFVETLFFFFPKHKTYLTPTERSFSYGFIPYFFTANTGLFIHKINLGTRAGGTGYTNIINAPAVSGTESDFKLSFDQEMNLAFCDKKQIFSGAKALQYRVNESGNAENYRQTYKFKKSVFSKSRQYSEEFTDFNEPVLLAQKTTSDAFSEFAGDKVLVKPDNFLKENIAAAQSFENENTAEVELECMEKNKSKILICIPKGYIVKNLDDFNKKLSYGTPEKPIAGFAASAKITEEGIEIKTEEYYNEITFGKEDLKKYHAVRAAARAFRELVLVFEKINVE
jgi:hypothetical protein